VRRPMPLAMCCSPNAAVSMSEDVGCVVEKSRRGTRAGRESAGTNLRRADGDPFKTMAAIFIVFFSIKLRQDFSYGSR
jgi:hypothetical protein